MTPLPLVSPGTKELESDPLSLCKHPLKLFLGFRPDSLFQHELKKANPYYINLMIGKQDYLQILHHQEKDYLGKFFESYPSIDQLHDFERHLLSLLQTLAPNYPFQDNPPKLIATHGT